MNNQDEIKAVLWIIANWKPLLVTAGYFVSIYVNTILTKYKLEVINKRIDDSEEYVSKNFTKISLRNEETASTIHDLDKQVSVMDSKLDTSQENTSNNLKLITESVSEIRRNLMHNG